jgi:hypothetical protein
MIFGADPRTESVMSAARQVVQHRELFHDVGGFSPAAPGR